MDKNSQGMKNNDLNKDKNFNKKDTDVSTPGHQGDRGQQQQTGGAKQDKSPDKSPDKSYDKKQDRTNV